MAKYKKLEPADNMAEFINILRENNELLEINHEVDTYLEITEIADRAVKEGREAILFTNVKNSKYPLLINLFGSKSRMELSLGVENLNEIGRALQTSLNLKNPNHFQTSSIFCQN